MPSDENPYLGGKRIGLRTISTLVFQELKRQFIPFGRTDSHMMGRVRKTGMQAHQTDSLIIILTVADNGPTSWVHIQKTCSASISK